MGLFLLFLAEHDSCLVKNFLSLQDMRGTKRSFNKEPLSTDSAYEAVDTYDLPRELKQRLECWGF